MSDLTKVIVFSLALIGLYSAFSTWYIPPIKPEDPPKDEAVDTSSMTPEELIAFGERLYNGKGACLLCHNPVGGRAPLLDNIVSVSGARLKDPRYKGKANDAAGYIYESMADPSAYVVAGYGVTGTNDKRSPMPDVRTGSIGLTEDEIKAVIAYLKGL